LSASPSLRRICLVRLSALGDVCLVVPLVRALQRAWPYAELSWVISPAGRSVVQGVSGVRFVEFDKRRGLGEYLRVQRELGPEPFDALLALQANLRANALYPLIPARRKIGFDRRRGKDGHGWFIRETIPPAREHFVDAYLGFARALGIRPGVPEWNLPVAPEDAAHARSLVAGLPRPLIAVQLAASKVERGWPMERYAQLLRSLAARWGAGFVLTGGPSRTERDLAEQLIQQLAGEVSLVNAVGRTAVPQLLALLAEVDLLIAPDTGPVHFATAFGTPVVGLYAVAPAQLSGPYFSRELTVDKFDEAAQRFLGRPAQELPWNRRVHHPEAMKLIQVEDVLAKVDSALTQRAGRGGKNTLARPGASS